MKQVPLILGMLLLMCGATLAQRTITGTISEPGGETLIGASVRVKGTNTGSVSDVDGKYSINGKAM